MSHTATRYTTSFEKVYSYFRYTAAFEKVYSCFSEKSSVGVLKSHELRRDLALTDEFPNIGSLLNLSYKISIQLTLEKSHQLAC